MKKILLAFFILLSFTATSQVLQKPNVYGYEWRRVVVDTLFAMPSDTFSVPATLQSFPFIARKGTGLYYWNTTSHIWEAGSAGATPTWQQTLTAGSTLTGNNTIAGGGFDFTFGNHKNFTIDADSSVTVQAIAGSNQAYSLYEHSAAGSTQATMLTNRGGFGNILTMQQTGQYGVSVELSNTVSNGHYQSLRMDSTGTYLKPINGDFFVDSIDAGAGTMAIRWNPATGKVTYADTTVGGGLGTLDTLPYPPWTVVQDAGGTSYKTAGQRVFNVKDYGATGDGTGTNDRAGIQAAINAAFANKGGKVWFPLGHYVIGDSLFTTSVPGTPNSQIYFPLNEYTNNTDSLFAIELEGEVGPNIFSNPLTDVDNPVTGVYIESTLRNTGNLFAASYSSGFWGNFNFLQVRMKNLRIRTDTDSSGVVVGASQTAIDASKLAMFSAEDIVIDVTNGYNAEMPQPTAVGIKMPVRYNFVSSNLNRVTIQGMYTAVQVNEHFIGSGLFIDYCYNGLEYFASDHSSHIDHIVIARTTNSIVMSGITFFAIDNLAIEWKDTASAGPSVRWWNGEYVLKEDVGGSYGHIRYHIAGLRPFVRTPATGSLITCLPMYANMETYTTSTRPQSAEGRVGNNITTGLLEYRNQLGYISTLGSNRGIGSIQFDEGTGSNASTELAYDVTNNSIILYNTSNNLTLQLRQLPSAASYGGIFTGNISPSSSNYTLAGNGTSETIIGVPDGSGSIYFRVNNNSSPNIAVMKAGQTGFYQNTPTAKLHIGAGTATASTAPLKFTTGTSLTTPEAGAMEYTTPQLFFTNGRAVRQEIPQIQQSRVSTQYDNTTTTLGNITGLTANVAASGTYRFEARLYTTSDVGGGVKVAIAGTATATAIIYEGLTTNAGLITQSRATALASAVGAVTAVTAAYVVITGTITVNAAGTLTVQAAANAATGTTSVLVGSTFVLTEMN